MNHTQLQAMRWMAGTILTKAINRIGDQLEKFNGLMDNDFKLTSISVDGEKMGDFVRGVVKQIIATDTSP